MFYWIGYERNPKTIHNQNGVTMIQLLVVLTALSIILSAFFAFLLKGAETYKFSSTKVDKGSQARNALRQVKNDLRDANSVIINNNFYAMTIKNDNETIVYRISANQTEESLTRTEDGKSRTVASGLINRTSDFEEPLFVLQPLKRAQDEQVGEEKEIKVTLVIKYSSNFRELSKKFQEKIKIPSASVVYGKIENN